jgi:hypothetical protein
MEYNHEKSTHVHSKIFNKTAFVCFYHIYNLTALRPIFEVVLSMLNGFRTQFVNLQRERWQQQKQTGARARFSQRLSRNFAAAVRSSSFYGSPKSAERNRIRIDFYYLFCYASWTYFDKRGRACISLKKKKI